MWIVGDRVIDSHGNPATVVLSDLTGVFDYLISQKVVINYDDEKHGVPWFHQNHQYYGAALYSVKELRYHEGNKDYEMDA